MYFYLTAMIGVFGENSVIYLETQRAGGRKPQNVRREIAGINLMLTKKAWRLLGN